MANMINPKAFGGRDYGYNSGRNELGDKCFADSVKVIQEHNHVRLFAEVDGVSFDSSDYDGDLVKWMNGIIDRVHACAMGELN